MATVKERRREAQSAHTSPQELEKLAGDTDCWVCRYVAHNPNCPTHALEKLAGAEDWWARWNVARNPNCPTHVLLQLLDDEDEDVEQAAVRRL